MTKQYCAGHLNEQTLPPIDTLHSTISSDYIHNSTMSPIRQALGLCILAMAANSAFAFFGFGGGMNEHHMDMPEPMHYTEHSFHPVHIFKPKFFKKPVPVPVIYKPIIKTIKVPVKIHIPVPYKVKEPYPVRIPYPVPVKVPVIHREKVPVPVPYHVKVPVIVREPYPVKHFVPIKIKEPVIVKVPVYKEYHHQEQQSYEHKPSYEMSSYNTQEMGNSGYNSPSSSGDQEISFGQNIGGGRNEYPMPEKDSGNEEDEGKYYQTQQQQQAQTQDAYGGQMPQMHQQSYDMQQSAQHYDQNEGPNENQSQSYAGAASGQVANVNIDQQHQRQVAINFHPKRSQISTETQYKTGQLYNKPVNYGQQGGQEQDNASDGYDNGVGNSGDNDQVNQAKKKK